MKTHIVFAVAIASSISACSPPTARNEADQSEQVKKLEAEIQNLKAEAKQPKAEVVKQPESKPKPTETPLSEVAAYIMQRLDVAGAPGVTVGLDASGKTFTYHPAAAQGDGNTLFTMDYTKYVFEIPLAKLNPDKIQQTGAHFFKLYCTDGQREINWNSLDPSNKNYSADNVYIFTNNPSNVQSVINAFRELIRRAGGKADKF